MSHESEQLEADVWPLQFLTCNFAVARLFVFGHYVLDANDPFTTKCYSNYFVRGSTILLFLSKQNQKSLFILNFCCLWFCIRFFCSVYLIKVCFRWSLSGPHHRSHPPGTLLEQLELELLSYSEQVSHFSVNSLYGPSCRIQVNFLL